LNGVTGFLFIFGDFGENDSVEKSMKFSFFGSGFRLILGILAAFTGVMKLFLPMHGIPILGDLLPALAGIGGSFMLLFGFYREHKTAYDNDQDNNLDSIGDIFIRYRKVAGFALVAIAVLHFVFPGALFL
jgi:hypothetical protein